MYSNVFNGICLWNAASQAETHVENRINPKMKMNKKELGIKKNNEK